VLGQLLWNLLDSPPPRWLNTSLSWSLTA